MSSSNTKFRAHFGNGYRAPALDERFGSGYNSTIGTFTYYGDPRLPAETSKSFDTGIDQWILRNKLPASGTFYYTDLSQTIIFGSFPTGYVDPFGRPSGYLNSVGGGISRGAEFSLMVTPTSRTSITSAYTYVNADTRFPLTVGTLKYNSAIRTANHIFSLTATQWITKRFNATADFYSISAPIENPFGPNRLIAFPGPKKLDLVLNYRVPIHEKYSVDVYTKVESLTNRRYSDNGDLAPQAWAIGGLKFNF